METLSEVQQRRLATSLPEVVERRLVIAIDYGTTYTGVAYSTPVGNRAVLDKISIVQDWGPGMGNNMKIPSVISYSLRSQANEQQWGTDLSPHAVAMVHTKLQLDVDDPSAELDLILQALDGMHDLDFQYIIDGGAEKYTRKGPEEIVKDYLTKVFEYLLNAVTPFTEGFRKTIPVDIVATIPAEWGYKAKNSTFLALTQAGFNNETFPQLRDILLVSEPEAAAIYTARFLKELHGEDFLRKGECFVLCDAGGGTVDVVSYKVKQLQQTFEIERVTMPTGYKCGSIFINLAFKKWLRDLLGKDIYQILDQAQLVTKIRSHDAEGERMRVLMKRFDGHKRRFAKGHRDIKIDLPEPFENLDKDNIVVGGQITIPYEDMVSFFEPSATRIVELIDNQREQIEDISDLRTRLKNVFLVGGFAESPYLRESIRESLSMRDLDLRIPDTSWTAVVRGAAIFGIEKSTNKALTTMSACARSYGVSVHAPFSDITHDSRDRVEDSLTTTAMAKDQLMWLIKKEDLILSNKPKEVIATFTKNFTETGPRTGTIPLYVFDGDRDRVPDRLANSQNELNMFHVVNYDLKDIPLQEFTCSKPVGLNPPFYVASLSLTMRLAPGMLQVELRLKNRVISTADVVEPPMQD